MPQRCGDRENEMTDYNDINTYFEIIFANERRFRVVLDEAEPPNAEFSGARAAG